MSARSTLWPRPVALSSPQIPAFPPARVGSSTLFLPLWGEVTLPFYFSAVYLRWSIIHIAMWINSKQCVPGDPFPLSLSLETSLYLCPFLTSPPSSVKSSLQPPVSPTRGFASQILPESQRLLSPYTHLSWRSPLCRSPNEDIRSKVKPSGRGWNAKRVAYLTKRRWASDPPALLTPSFCQERDTPGALIQIRSRLRAPLTMESLVSPREKS